MIRVLIVDDSRITQHYLQQLLERDGEIEVVGRARNGREAVALASELKPDVVTMDVHLPGLNGLEATRHIMEASPVPVIICSACRHTVNDREADWADAGAVAAIETPLASMGPEKELAAARFLSTVKTMANVKVVRRWDRNKYRGSEPVEDDLTVGKVRPPGLPVKAVVMGASTGGPPVLQMILKSLPRPFPVPILIVQHIAPGFLNGLGYWLRHSTGFPVHIARDGERAMPDCAYLAPDTHHMILDGSGRIQLLDDAPVNHLKPAIAPLFESVATHLGKEVLAVLLTGMGRDGALEMRNITDAGGVTIAQDEASSAVYGMPAEAIRLGGVSYVEPADAIANRIVKLMGLPG